LSVFFRGRPNRGSGLSQSYLSSQAIPGTNLKRTQTTDRRPEQFSVSRLCKMTAGPNFSTGDLTNMYTFSTYDIEGAKKVRNQLRGRNLFKASSSSC